MIDFVIFQLKIINSINWNQKNQQKPGKNRNFRKRRVFLWKWLKNCWISVGKLDFYPENSKMPQIFQINQRNCNFYPENSKNLIFQTLFRKKTFKSLFSHVFQCKQLKFPQIFFKSPLKFQIFSLTRIHGFSTAKTICNGRWH